MDAILNDFPVIDKSTWKAQLEKDLKGISYEALTTIDNNGIVIAPFYTREDLPLNCSSYHYNPNWDIITKIIVEDSDTANQIALQQLTNGVNGLHFVINEVADFNILFKQIDLPSIFVKIAFNKAQDTQTAALKAYILEQGYDWVALSLHIVYNPLLIALEMNTAFDPTTWLKWMQEAGAKSNISIDGIVLKNAGATTAYTLAIIASQLNEYLELIRANNLEKNITHLYIDYAVGTKLFEEIAGIRALKNIIDTLLQAHQLQNINVHLHIETSSIYKASQDVYSNLLRDTIAAISAIIGGCTSLCVTAFNQQEAQAFSLRMSKNIQLILKDEAYLNKVTDISAGSYYIESRTKLMAENAWHLFQNMEKEGGFLAQKEQMLHAVKEQATDLIQRYKDGKEILIGVNKYPNPNDQNADTSVAISSTNSLAPINITNAIKAS